MSQPPNSSELSGASGTNSSMRGQRSSVRLPSRIVPCCVRLPTGLLRPLRIASTPATNVVATAPMPGSSTPSFPLAGRISRPFPLAIFERPPLWKVLTHLLETRMLPRTSYGAARTTDASGARLKRAEPRRGGRARRSAPQARSKTGVSCSNAPSLAEELERGARQLAIVPRSDEAALADVVVKDARAREALVGLEGVEDEDSGFAGKAAVVEEPEAQVAHRQVSDPPQLSGGIRMNDRDGGNVVRPSHSCQGFFRPRGERVPSKRPSGMPDPPRFQKAQFSSRGDRR